MPKPNRVGLNLGALAASFEAKLTRFGAAVRTGGAKATEAQMRDVHRVIVLTAPVDTGRLRRSWPPPTARGSDMIWGTGTTLDYAPTLEYGGYRRVGPRTVEAGPGDLGAGFTAGAGIYSSQAPLGFVRRALAGAAQPYRRRLQNLVQQAFGEGVTVNVGRATSPVLGDL